jgi:hypothetical protein
MINHPLALERTERIRRTLRPKLDLYAPLRFAWLCALRYAKINLINLIL